MATQIQWRRDTAANWTAVDPILAEGEAGLETDTGRFKIGDGVTTWTSLAYFTDGVGLGALSAGTQSASSGTMVFANSNGISFGMSDSSRVTASYTVPSTAGLLSAVNISGGTTSNNLSALTFSDGGNVSFGLNGSVITASAPAGGGGGVALSAGTQSVSTGTMVFANSNGVTFGMSGSSQITASYTVPTQSAQTLGVYGSSQTTGESSSSTVDARSLTFRGGGIVSVGMSAGEVVISATGGGGGLTPALSGSNGSFTFSTATLGNLNGLSFYTSNGSMVGSYTVPSVAGLLSAVNVSAGTTSNNLSALTFGDANGVSFGLDGSTITASLAPGGGGGATWQDWDNAKVIQSMNLISNITATIFSRGRPLLVPIEMDGHLAWNKARIIMSRATSGSNAFTIGLGIYSFANSSQLSLMGSLTNAFSNTATASVSGIRVFELSGIGTGASSLTPGHYIAALMFSALGDSTASMNYSLRGGVTAAPPVGMIRPGSDSNITATSALRTLGFRQFRGFWSTTTANPPDSIGLTQMSMWTTGGHPYLWLGTN